MTHLLVWKPTARKGREVATLITLSLRLLSLLPGPCSDTRVKQEKEDVAFQRASAQEVFEAGRHLDADEDTARACVKHRRFEALLQAPGSSEGTWAMGAWKCMVLKILQCHPFGQSLLQRPQQALPAPLLRAFALKEPPHWTHQSSKILRKNCRGYICHHV